MKVLPCRADIDGLRGLAVILVLFYHLGMPVFSGGFLGVDIFMTLSGYLVTGMILKDLERGRFSITAFYSRRAIRLLPATLPVLVLVLGMSLWLTTPVALKATLDSALTFTLFSSNFYFLLTRNDYFEPASQELPLLHTWSLGVEEQFCLLMPLILILWLKLPNRNLRKVLVLPGLIVAIVVSWFVTHFCHKVGYYMVVSRFYEFLIGGVLAVALAARKPTSTPVKAAG